MNFIDQWPKDSQQALGRLYAGDIFLLPSNDQSLDFQQAVLSVVERDLGQEYRVAHQRYNNDEFFRRVGKLRKEIFTSSEFHQLINRLIESLGFALPDVVYDPGRLRVVAHDGHLNPAAAPVYHGHRDTWYSNPQPMITWWIPLHDVTPAETFEFFPGYFQRVVRNDSEAFDFGSWTEVGQENRIGWQNKETGRVKTYPRLLESVDDEPLPVAANGGDVLLFSGQHLHRTRHNTTGRTRFSVDFRTVNQQHVVQQIGPVNVDDRSTGCSISQFVKP